MADIERTEVVSSNLEAFSYDAEAKELHVWFRSGAEYVYAEVPQDVADGLLKASSKGKYLNEHIKQVYQYEKV